jgi:hypothetical protein
MTLSIQDDGITSNHSPFTARLLPGDQPRWEVSWLPGQLMDRNHALTAMALADATSADAQTGHQLSMNTINYAAKLIGPEPEATGDTSGPHARTEPGKSGQLSDPEAGG